MRRNRLINITAIDALIITILSFRLYLTEFWLWGVAFSLVGMLWLLAYATANFDWFVDRFLKEEEPAPAEATDSIMISTLNNNKKAA